MLNKEVFRDFSKVGQTFSQFEDEYFLNKDGVLEKYPAQRDCQAYIDSQVETTLQKIFDVLLEQPVGYQNPATDYVNERIDYATDLDILLEADAVVEDYKTAHPDFKGSRSDIIKNIKKEIERSYADYEAQVKAQKESKQEELPKDGAEGTSS